MSTVHAAERSLWEGPAGPAAPAGDLGGTIHAVLDLDGVAYDFVRAIRSHVGATMGRKHLPYATTWNFFEQWGLTVSQFLDAFSDGVLNGSVFRHGTPMPGAAEGWAALAARDDVVVHVVTDRSPKGAEQAAYDATVSWLAREGLVYDHLDVTADKVDAVAARAAGRPVWTFDDRDKNYLAYADAGFVSVLCRRPWNDHIDGDDVLEAPTIAEFASLLPVPAR